MSRIGVAFSGGLTATEIADCAERAEGLGYESVWVAEGHGGDQFAILAACALRTRRIRLGTAISSVFVRTAPTIAMAAATVDELSGGRFVLGLGSSHRVQVGPEHGVEYARPLDRIRDTVADRPHPASARARSATRARRSGSSASTSGSGPTVRTRPSTSPPCSRRCWS